MKTLRQYKQPKGTRVLVRVDYNVPIQGTKIRDTRRIVSSYESIDLLLKKGATPVLLAHLGDGKASLRPIAKFLSKRYKIVFITNDIFDPRTHDICDRVPSGTVILFENIRRYPGEEKNDKVFARTLASYASVYVNDAFSVSHRAHASVVGLPKLLPHYAGYQFEHELQALSMVLTTKKHPFLFILGGAKFSTKIPLLARFENIADHLIIGGAILNNFYREAGFAVGNSVVESGYEKPIKKMLKNEKLLLPVDVVVIRADKKIVTTPDAVQAKDVIVDIGPQSITMIQLKIKKAKMIVWNGPMGWYEKGCTKGTTALATAIAESSANAVIGGGDTGAVIERALETNKNKKIFISTAGGAALEFLATGTLPGIKALQ